MRVGWLLLIFLPSLVFAAPTQLADVRIAAAEDNQSRIVFDLTSPTHYHYFQLQNPRRLVIDFDDTDLETDMSALDFSNTAIKAMRHGRRPQHGLRVVMELQSPVKIHAFNLAANEIYGERVVLDLTAKTSKPAPHKTLKPTMTVPHSNSLRKVTVLIDPGHGGKDPGAIGAHGIREKDVVLGISKELYKLIQKEPGMQAVMTRKGDYYISLRRRLRAARKDNADIFVAIHADAFKNARSSGSSVYALSLKGATSEAARWLAAKENYSELGGVNLDGKGDVLRSVLIDLSQTATIGAGLQLGSDILSQLSHVAHLHHASVEQAAFVVLKSPDIPSVLVEAGFLSNPREASKLHSKAYQKKVAQAVMRGIREYFYQRPPPGTWIAAHAEQQKYKIAQAKQGSHTAHKRYTS